MSDAVPPHAPFGRRHRRSAELAAERSDDESMRNRERWRASKFVLRKGKLTGSRDRAEVAVCSRLMADLVASRYQELLPKHAAGRLLDLGCGKVPLLTAYEPYVEETICVDWNDSPRGNQYLDLTCDLTRPLPFPDARFDTVILSDVLEHLPTPAPLWSEIARVLSGRGKLLLNVPFLYWIHEAPHDYYRYTEFALRRFAEQSGLNVLALESIGGAPEVLCDVSAKLLQYVPYVGPHLSSLMQWSIGVFLKTSLGRSLSRRTRAVFPYGYVVVAEKSG